MNPVRVALIGAGHLGTYHCEKLFRIKNCELVTVCDHHPERARKLAQKYSCRFHSSFREVVNEVDAVLIATPTPTHFEIARFFLENNRHVFIEKPITQKSEQAHLLCRLADEKGLVLQVGHVERFNPAFLKAGEHLKKILFVEARRMAPFKSRNIDVDVVCDLMIHDIDLILSLIKNPVIHVSAVGVPVITSHVDIANARLEFESGTVANITASRVSSSLLRRLEVFQGSECLNLDFGSVELDLFRAAANGKEEKSQTWNLPKGDALLVEDQAFIDSIEKSQPPAVTGWQALEALKLAERILEKIHTRNSSNTNP